MWAQVLFYKGDAPNALRPLTSVLSVHRFVAASAVDGLRGWFSNLQRYRAEVQRVGVPLSVVGGC